MQNSVTGVCVYCLTFMIVYRISLSLWLVGWNPVNYVLVLVAGLQ